MAVYDAYYETLQDRVAHFQCKLARASTESERIAYLAALQAMEDAEMAYDSFKQDDHKYWDRLELDRGCLEPVLKSLTNIEWFGAVLQPDSEITVDPSKEDLITSLLQTRDKVAGWLRSHRNPAARLAPEDGYWAAYCPSCGWAGSSNHAEGGELVGDSGDHSEVICPVCRSVVECDESL